MNTGYLIAFISYFAFFVGLSIYFFKKTNNTSNFILGNRSMPYWVTAISAQASDMSDWLFMAYPGLIYALGLFNIWVAIGLTLFMFLNWHFVAPKLRAATEKYQSLTLSSFFEKRFNDTTGTIRLLAVFFTLFFLSFYIAAELIGLGRLFETTFSINYNIGIALSILLVVFNIFIGGFVALAWSDLFRGLFLLFMITLVPVVAISHIGGISGHIAHISFSDIASKLVPSFDLSTLSSILLLMMGWGLGYFGSPHILINFMSIDDIKKISQAKYIGITWQILVLAAATLVGVIGTVFFPHMLQNRELVFIEMVKQLFSPLFAGFILCAILAATMSVMTAQILATASIISEDMVKRLRKQTLSEQANLWLLRICIVLIPLLSYAISFNNRSTVNDLISYAWSGLGLAFAPVVISALYGGKYVNKNGIIASMLLCGTLGIIWPYLHINALPLLPGCSLGLVTIFGVSALTKELSVSEHQVSKQLD